jgi:glycosyltransferase involved in cell wall biosynthesis
MKIIHVVDSMEMGGAEILVALLCRSQRREGHTPSIYCLFRVGTLGEELQSEGFGVRAFNPGSGPLGKLRLLRALHRAFSQVRPDVVHCHNMTPSIWGAPSARLAGVPAILSTRHGLAIPWGTPSEVKGIPDMISPFFKFRLAATCITRVVAVCSVAHRNLESGPLASLYKTVTIRNGALPMPTSAAPDPTIRKPGFTLINVARLNWKKNHASLLQAVAIAARQVRDLHLWLVGDGAERAKLEDLARQLGIQNHVRFAGERKDVGDWLAQADVFVLSSLTEGLPVSLIEALAAGLPFVATNVGAVSEVADLSSAGTVVEANRPEALAAALVQIAQNREQLSDLRSRARRAYEQHFTPDRMVNAYSQLYETCLNESRRSVQRGPSVANA